MPSADAESERVLALTGTTVGADDIVYRTDGLQLAWISPSVANVLGFAPEELVGGPARALLSPDQDTSWLDENRMRLLAGQEVVQRMLMRDSQGRDIPMVGVARPLPGTSDGFVAMVRVEDRAAARRHPGGVEPGALPVEGVEVRQGILSFIDDQLDGVNGTLAVVVVEFSNLRMINDSLGFEAGDAALTELARRMRASLDRQDRIGRVSGREFLIVRPGPSTIREVEQRVAELLVSWSTTIVVDGLRVDPVLSAAVVSASAGSTALSLLREADVALSYSRLEGNSAVVVFEEEMGARALRRFVMEDELRFALDAGEFDLHFQPIVHLPDASLVATEALVRWRHPREGMLTPVSFMPVAEDSRLIGPLGRLVLARALDALTALPPHALQVGINVSAVELSDPTWLDAVSYTIERSGVDPCCLVMEITETAVLDAHRDLSSDLKRLRDMGVGLFLDDFGTGYSSLAMLRDLPVTGIKLDKSFVASLGDPGSFGAALAQGILDLIRPLGIAGVAEGIETMDQAARLAELGWEFGQGFAFGRPGPFEELPSLPARPLGGH